MEDPFNPHWLGRGKVLLYSTTIRLKKTRTLCLGTVFSLYSVGRLHFQVETFLGWLSDVQLSILLGNLLFKDLIKDDRGLR